MLGPRLSGLSLRFLISFALQKSRLPAGRLRQEGGGRLHRYYDGDSGGTRNASLCFAVAHFHR